MRGLALWLGCCLLIVASCSSAPAGPAKDPLADQYTGAGSGGAIEALTAR
ncbi:MAG TPA: hypothetical protein VHG53_07500 [Candidatus Limnocylindria bacterium]|nr:hypothetical protein [Candidatus Limnocylindria bacterium]